MTGLRQAAEDYLAVRRSLGFKLNDYPWLLSGLVGYLGVRLSERWLISGCFGHAARLRRSMVSSS
jgi:hypothetical protein